MRLQDDPYLPSDLPGLVRQLTALYRQIASQVNQLSEGKLSAVTNAQPEAPTTGVHAAGDIVRHAEPVEAGSAGSEYVLFGWVCVAAGEPGTWAELRIPTGG